MLIRLPRLRIALVLTLVGSLTAVWAGPPAVFLPAELMHSSRPLQSPVANTAYVPGGDATPGEPFSGAITLTQSPMQTLPLLDKPVIDGRDARLFPGVRLAFFTMGDVLVPVECGEMVKELQPVKVQSYWRVIPQFG